MTNFILAALVFIGLSSNLSSSPVEAQTLPCSQPISSGPDPVASDCLFILQAAVGNVTCTPECVCAPTGPLPGTATDALLCLRADRRNVGSGKRVSVRVD